MFVGTNEGKGVLSPTRVSKLTFGKQKRVGFFARPEDRWMNRRAITNICAITSSLFLLVIGILHSIVNFSGLRRALVRGEIAARLGDTVLFNAVFSGLFMSLLGLLVLSGLRAGSRLAGRVAIAIG